MSDYYSDSDDNNTEDFILNKRHGVIKDFTLNDYLNCPETKYIIFNEWEERFSEDLEGKIHTIFNKYRDALQCKMSNVFYCSESYHSQDLCNLVKHHLIKDLTLDMFTENPFLAEPLISSIEKIKQAKRNERIKQMNDNIKQSNKLFAWVKNKKKNK